jgi:glycosyltransferase involved in cell wall biosynthesis
MSQSETDALVSVIIPTHNRGRTLRRAVNSVLTQDYENLELIIVDDASTDDTQAVLAEFNDPRVRWLTLEKNGGASRARNIGMREAKGRFIAFQDSDDEWLAGKLRRQVEAAQAAASDAVTVFHTKILLGRDTKANYGPHLVCCIPQISGPATRAHLLDYIHRGNIISTQTLLLSRAALEKVGFFDELLVNSNDWDYAIRLIYDTETVFIDEPLVMTYLQHDSLMRRKRSGARSELRIMQKLRRRKGVDAVTLGDHYGRIGWGISKLGKPKLARRLLRRAISMSPGNWKNWARLTVTEALVIAPVGIGGRAQKAAQ